MWGARRQVSLLLDHGHRDARFYPLGMVWEEAMIVVERMNQELASQMALMQLVGHSVMSKNGAKALRTALKELTSG